ncbi:1149_t:CDS:1, partial [Funneliformis caledonium]
MEVDPVEEGSNNNLDKGKSIETIASTSEITAPKLTTSIDESFDASENLLNTSTIGFDAPSMQ